MQEMKRELELFFPLGCLAIRSSKRGTEADGKLPWEALNFVAKVYFKSQLGIVRVRARFVLDSSRVYFTSALNL